MSNEETQQAQRESWNAHKYINFKMSDGKTYDENKQERLQFLASLTEEQRNEFLTEERNEGRERQRRWREANPEQVKAMWKKYKEANKEKIREKGKSRVTCECGAEIAKQSLNGHLKTKTHLNWKDNQLVSETESVSETK